ncbi:hypothetical protein B0H10DRAFT_2311930, partial [Mycena sp. CBHHK59/15]
FSLHALVQELFTSDHGSIKNVTNSYLSTGGGVHLLETAIGDKGLKDTAVADWIMEKATFICTTEVSWLTDKAHAGDYLEDAKYLRVPANSIKIGLLQSFSVPSLLLTYEWATSRLQRFLTTLIGKDPLPPGADISSKRCQRNPDMVFSTLF